MLNRMGRSSWRARCSASSPQGYQSTGFSECCKRYGLVSSINRLGIVALPGADPKNAERRIFKIDSICYHRRETFASITDAHLVHSQLMKISGSLVRTFTALAFAVAIVVSVVGCAPAAGPGGAAGGGQPTAANSVGVEVGRQSPAFAMTLSDGSQVTSASLVEAAQPVHLFWFATW